MDSRQNFSAANPTRFWRIIWCRSAFESLPTAAGIRGDRPTKDVQVGARFERSSKALVGSATQPTFAPDDTSVRGFFMSASRSESSAKDPLQFDRRKLAALTPEQASYVGLPQEDQAHRLYCRTIRDHWDTSDFAINNADQQRTNEQLVAELNGARYRQKKLTNRELSAYRVGLIGKVYGRPDGRMCPVKRRDRDRLLLPSAADVNADARAAALRKLGAWQPTVVVRLDFDAHNGERDAEALARDVSDTFFNGHLYLEPSSRGWAGYAIIDLAKLPWRGVGLGPYGTGLFVRSREHEDLKELENALADWGIGRGYHASIELQGDETIRQYREGKVVAITHRGGLGRLPRCKRDADVHDLVASRFSYEVLQRTIAKAAAEDRPSVAAAESQAAVSTPRTKKSQLKKVSVRGGACHAASLGPAGTPSISDSGDKHTNSLLCCRAAINCLAWRGATLETLSGRQLDQLVDAALSIYEGNDFHSGPRDARRRRRFERLICYMLETHNLDAPGRGITGGLHATDVDFLLAEAMLRSQLSRATLSAWYNRPEFAALRKQRSFDYDKLVSLIAYAAVAYANNVWTDRLNEVPTASIQGWLKHFEFKSVNGTTVCFVTTILERVLNWVTRLAHHAIGQCTKWAFSLKVARKLPFLRGVVGAETATATATGSESGWMKGHRQVVKETSIGEGQWPAHSLKLDPASAVRVVAVATGPLLPPATAIQGQKWPKNWGDNPYLHGDHLRLSAPAPTRSVREHRGGPSKRICCTSGHQGVDWRRDGEQGATGQFSDRRNHLAEAVKCADDLSIRLPQRSLLQLQRAA